MLYIGVNVHWLKFILALLLKIESSYYDRKNMNRDYFKQNNSLLHLQIKFNCAQNSNYDFNKIHVKIIHGQYP